MTGWLAGQIFVQTVDEKEVEAVTGFLNARGLAFQVLTLSERMVLDASDPASGVSSDRFSIAIQLGGFPQVLGPVLTDLVQRVHGGNWEPDPPTAEGSGRCAAPAGPAKGRGAELRRGNSTPRLDRGRDFSPC